MDDVTSRGATALPVLPRRSGAPAWFATAIVLVAVLSLIGALFPATATVADGYLSTLMLFVGALPSLQWVVVLLLVAAAVAARKRAGWFVVLLFAVAALLLDLTAISAGDGAPLDWTLAAAALFHLAVTVLLLVWYREFPARARSRALLRVTLTVVVAVAAATAVGWIVVSLFPGQLPADARLPYAFNGVVGDVFDESVVPRSGPAPWVDSFLSVLETVTTLSVVVALFRSRRAANTLQPHEEAATRALLERFGAADSLGYFATRRDKSVVFGPDGRAAVTYRVEAGVCLASGDPVGAPASWDGAVTAWLDLASRFGWATAVLGASASGAQAYRRHGLAVLDLGDEAVVDISSFSLRGPDAAALRQAAARAGRDGVSVRIRRQHQVPTEELTRAGELADAWRGAEPERGFSMALGRWADPADGECVLVEAVREHPGQAAELVGLLTFVPWGPAGASLDVMRRSPAAPNGTTELMVTELCRRAEEVGVRRISLNFAMFRDAFEQGEQLGAGPVLRLWRWVLLFLSRWWQLESLYRTNAKYHPTWTTRYLCFADVRHLPRIGVAVAVAEGFLRLPRLGRTHRVDAHIPSSAPVAPVALADDEPEPIRRPEQVVVRMRKADRLATDGVSVWPAAQVPSHDTAKAIAAEGSVVQVAGRVIALRDFGGVVFVRVRDWAGDLQALLEAGRIGSAELSDFGHAVDIGDLIQVTGVMGRSRSGEVSLLVDRWRINAKCLHPLPAKWHGVSDPEFRVRNRHVDLAINPDTRGRISARAAVVRSLRETLHSEGFMEVETPILQQTHGGANARPFRTHINAYDLDLYLRIAPELYLKRLCVGGMERIFELGRVFRNEGVDFSHNPEFTILEAYQAHADYRDMLDLCRRMIQQAAIAATGACAVPAPDGTRTDISGEWPVIPLYQAVSSALIARGGEPIDAGTPVETLRGQCDLAGVPWMPAWDPGQVALEMYERLVEEQTTRPTFYTDFPLSVSPLTRSHRTLPGVTERWDLVAWGVELGTAYSELTDPLEQRRRLTEQSRQAAAGDQEAMELDEDFLRALEYGMPPTGGLGIGVDRIVMLVTGSGIRETLPFPMNRPR